MHTTNWSEILPKIAPLAAIELDDVLQDFDPRLDASGRTLFPQNPYHHPPEFVDPETTCVGIAVRAAIDTADIAMKLASLAMEKGVTPVVFCHLEYSGLERFGFRVEKISGASDADEQACIDQLKQFWGISVMI